MPRAKKSARQYIRNTRYVPVGLRLGTGRRIELSPRGQRGDIAPVNEEEMEDEIFLGNKDLVFEVISMDSAKATISKQTTNQQARHPALAVMRNELGEEYEHDVVVEPSNVEQAKIVAEVTERGVIQRYPAPGTADRPFPEVPSDIPPEQVADWVARNTNVEGPEAGLTGLKVTKEEVKQS